MLDYERVGMAELEWWADWWLLFHVSGMWEMLPLLLLLFSLVVCKACGRDVG